MSKGTKKQHLNGSVDILASAMKAVFQEGMDATRKAVKEDVDGLRTDIKSNMDSMEERLKEDTAQQIAQQETRFNTSLGKLQKSLIEQRSTKTKSTSKRSTART